MLCVVQRLKTFIADNQGHSDWASHSSIRAIAARRSERMRMCMCKPAWSVGQDWLVSHECQCPTAQTMCTWRDSFTCMNSSRCTTATFSWYQAVYISGSQVLTLSSNAGGAVRRPGFCHCQLAQQCTDHGLCSAHQPAPAMLQLVPGTALYSFLHIVCYIKSGSLTHLCLQQGCMLPSNTKTVP